MTDQRADYVKKWLRESADRGTAVTPPPVIDQNAPSATPLSAEDSGAASVTNQLQNAPAKSSTQSQQNGRLGEAALFSLPSEESLQQERNICSGSLNSPVSLRAHLVCQEKEIERIGRLPVEQYPELLRAIEEVQGSLAPHEETQLMLISVANRGSVALWQSRGYAFYFVIVAVCRYCVDDYRHMHGGYFTLACLSAFIYTLLAHLVSHYRMEARGQLKNVLALPQFFLSLAITLLKFSFLDVRVHSSVLLMTTQMVGSGARPGLNFLTDVFLHSLFPLYLTQLYWRHGHFGELCRSPSSASACYQDYVYHCYNLIILIFSTFHLFEVYKTNNYSYAVLKRWSLDSQRLQRVQEQQVNIVYSIVPERIWQTLFRALQETQQLALEKDISLLPSMTPQVQTSSATLRSLRSESISSTDKSGSRLELIRAKNDRLLPMHRMIHMKKSRHFHTASASDVMQEPENEKALEMSAEAADRSVNVEEVTTSESNVFLAAQEKQIIFDQINALRGVNLRYSNVVILTWDIVQFTALSMQLTSSELALFLDTIFKEFDQIVEELDFVKIRTMGDSYLCCAGMTDVNISVETNAEAMIRGTFVFFDRVKALFGEHVQMRCGMHIGDVEGGIFGTKKPFFDIWSNDVTMAYELEHEGEPGCLHVSAQVMATIEESDLMRESWLSVAPVQPKSGSRKAQSKLVMRW